VEERRGPLFAIHRGILEARGQFVTSCDADTIYPKGWLERMVRGLDRRGVVAVCGPMAFSENGPFLRFLSLIGFCVIVGFSRLFGVRLCGAANLGIRKQAYLSVGGYSLESALASQDLRLVRRLASRGKVRFLPTLVCYTSNRRYKRRGFLRTLAVYFRLWHDVARQSDKMTYSHYYGEDYYRHKQGSSKKQA
jgi:cellulose synthase/poly-beta-1,6-N-acetylglucosamine synthase-like glycosyltransferase